MSQLTKEKKQLSRNAQAEAFDTPRTRYVIDPNFRWITQQGESIHPTAMSTWHLFNSLKMIWNHTVPGEFQFMPYKPYHLSITRRRRAECVSNLFLELMNRTDRTKVMDEVLAKMAEFVIGVKNKKLNSSIFFLHK